MMHSLTEHEGGSKEDMGGRGSSSGGGGAGGKKSGTSNTTGGGKGATSPSKSKYPIMTVAERQALRNANKA